MMAEDVREKFENGLGNFCSGSIPLYMSPSCITFHPWADCVQVDQEWWFKTARLIGPWRKGPPKEIIRLGLRSPKSLSYTRRVHSPCIVRPIIKDRHVSSPNPSHPIFLASEAPHRFSRHILVENLVAVATM